VSGKDTSYLTPAVRYYKMVLSLSWISNNMRSRITTFNAVTITTRNSSTKIVKVFPWFSGIRSSRNSSSINNSDKLWLVVRRNLGHKARIGNQLSNLRQSLLEKQHEESMPRRSKNKNKKKHGVDQDKEDEEDETEKEDTEDEDDKVMKKFNAGFDEFMMEGKPTSKESGSNSASTTVVMLPDTHQLKDQMKNVVHHLEKSLRLVRGGEPTPDMFDNILVFAYGGTATPLPTVAQVILVSPSLAKVTCYDPTNTMATRDAIRDAGMNLNPQIDSDSSDDGVVLVPLPKVSAETRKLLVKQVAHMGETTKNKLRHLRRTAHDIVKKGQLGKLEGISKDDAYRVGKEVEAVTEEAISMVHSIIEKKQQSVMAT
jgi:ribosome recycling factor